MNRNPSGFDKNKTSIQNKLGSIVFLKSDSSTLCQIWLTWGDYYVALYKLNLESLMQSVSTRGWGGGGARKEGGGGVPSSSPELVLTLHRARIFEAVWRPVGV
jgi:hypothetical protein